MTRFVKLMKLHFIKHDLQHNLHVFFQFFIIPIHRLFQKKRYYTLNSSCWLLFRNDLKSNFEFFRRLLCGEWKNQICLTYCYWLIQLKSSFVNCLMISEIFSIKNVLLWNEWILQSTPAYRQFFFGLRLFNKIAIRKNFWIEPCRAHELIVELCKMGFLTKLIFVTRGQIDWTEAATGWIIR